MGLAFFFIFLNFVFSDKFPPIKFPKEGIFKWFHSLSNVKKHFHDRKIFGFRINSSEPDLTMIAKDIALFLNLTDLNISGKISDVVNEYNPQPKLPGINTFLSKKDCPREYENIYQFCRLTGVSLDLESYGIPNEHVDIMLSNIVGYLPCGLFLVILVFSTLAFYIVQIILSFYFFKPSDNTSPHLFQIILFYTGDTILLTSAILYFFSYMGIDSLLSTIIQFDSVVSQITESLSSSIEMVASVGIPNAIGPVIKSMVTICNTTQNYFQITAKSFLKPTITILQKLISKNETDLGVFTIYNYKVYQLANDFYKSAKKYPKLNNISKYFAKYDFTSFQDKIQNLLDKEMAFADKMRELNSIFDYINSTIYPYQEIVMNLKNQEIKAMNKTVGEMIIDLQNRDLTSYTFISKLNQNVKENTNFYHFILVAFFIFGVVLAGAPFLYGVVYMMHNKFSICIAHTISIYPIIATILMFFIAFIFTEFGSADVSLSEQFEPAIDTFLTSVVDITIPVRKIEIPVINISQQTFNYYKGAINLSNIIFPNPMNNIQYFVNANKTTGLADSLQLSKIVDLSQYGDELGDFLIDLSSSFKLPKIVHLVFEGVEQLFRLVSYFPKSIDGLFNWGIPISLTTKHLRWEINQMDPSALPELEPYLSKIDEYVDLMNSQYKVVLFEIYDELANAIDKLCDRLVDFIKSILNDLGFSIKHLLKNVYPVLNYIQIEPIIGPYAMVRNIIFYDLVGTSAFISISGMLMMIGFVFIVALMWIRRKGMCPSNSLEVRRNKSNKLTDDANAVDKVAL